MLRIILGLFGIATLIFVIIDVLWTTLFLAGGGPLTSRLVDFLWRLLLHHHHRQSGWQLPTAAGLLIVLFTTMIWAFLMWASWSLIFSMTDQAVIETTSGRPADGWARAYFAGFTLITLGIGDYRPGGPVWQIATVVAAANGFFLVTLAIAYLLPLITAVVQKRNIAAYIASLGHTPEDILLRGWNGSDFGRLGDHLVALAPRLMELGQNHLAYPVLHCFHSAERETAVAPSIAALDEALTLLRHGVDRSVRPDRPTLDPLRSSITKFVTTLGSLSSQSTVDLPPAPSLERLRTHGIPVRDDAVFLEEVGELADRRRQLLSMVYSEGWTWETLASRVPLDERPGGMPPAVSSPA